jgi:hypothetical protein
VINMDESDQQTREERRRALNRREIELAISDVKGNRPDDPAFRASYRALILRR